jgi:hypothetical protein
MPAIEPSWSARNLTPSSTALVSPESTTAGVARSKIIACGVTAFDGLDSGLAPTSFVAVTRNV